VFGVELLCVSVDKDNWTLYVHDEVNVVVQVIEGLGFLHNSVHLVHSNVCPESIFVNSIGCWKIAGFDFCINNSNTQSQQV